jgi:hypothetical protein
MSSTREELQQLMDELDKATPMMLKACHDDAAFWLTFTRVSDSIQEAAAAGDADWAKDGIDNILRKHGRAINRTVVVKWARLPPDPLPAAVGYVFVTHPR